MALRTVKSGTWLYDDTIEKPVDIIALDYDWWYEMARADGMPEEDESPMTPGKDGYLYYVRFQRALEPEEPTWVDSLGVQDIEDAMLAAEQKVAGAIN